MDYVIVSTSYADYSFCDTAIGNYDEYNNLISHGVCGETVNDCSWIFNMTTKHMSVKGNGKMSNYSQAKPPVWSDFCDETGTISFGGITSIGAFAFDSFMKITSLQLPSSVVAIHKNAFDSCEQLQSVTLPSQLQRIETNAFYNCQYLTSITIPQTVNSIGSYAFGYGTRLDPIVFEGDKQPSVCETSAFSACISMKYIEVPSTYQSDSFCGEEVAFKGKDGNYYVMGSCGERREDCHWTYCDETNELEISGTGKMNDYLYDRKTPWNAYLKSIKLITINDGLQSLGSYCFRDCEMISSIVIPSSITTIGEFVFTYCVSLEEIIVDEQSTSFKSSNGVLYTFNGETLVQYPIAKTDISYEMLPTVKTIGRYAFYTNNQLERIHLPEEVETIHIFAFGFCNQLTTVRMPQTISEINYHAFYRCFALTSVYFGGYEEPSKCNEYAFYDCMDLKNVTVDDMYEGESFCGEEVEYVDDEGNHILKGKCGEKSTDCSYRLVIEKGDLTLKGNGPMSSYVQNTIPWGKYAKTIVTVTLEGITTISNYSFYGFVMMKEVSIPSSVTSIGMHVFDDCPLLESINVDSENNQYSSVDGVLFDKRQTTIVRYPQGKKLSQYTLPDDVLILGDSSFTEATLTDIVFPASLTTIGEEACMSMKSLTTVTIPASVEYIGENAFASCWNLTSVHYLGISNPLFARSDPFSDCSEYFQVYVPSNYQSIMFCNHDCIYSQTETSSIKTGKCGATPKECHYEYHYNEKMLYIKGNGHMNKYHQLIERPWHWYYNHMSVVHFDDGVQSIGQQAFREILSLEEVYISSSVQQIGSNAFYNIPNLKWVEYEGEHQPSCDSTTFEATLFEHVEVSDSYSDDTFCGIQVESDYSRMMEKLTISLIIIGCCFVGCLLIAIGVVIKISQNKNRRRHQPSTYLELEKSTKADVPMVEVISQQASKQTNGQSEQSTEETSQFILI